MAEPWPADGDAGICPDCNKPVYFTDALRRGYGVWFHEDGRENCDA